MKRERRDEIKKLLNRLERENFQIQRKQDIFREELSNIVRTAKELALVREDESLESSIEQLTQIVSVQNIVAGEDVPAKYEQIEFEINGISRKIRSLQKFTTEYKKYKINLKETDDSLKPISFIADNYSKLVKTSIYADVITALKKDQVTIRKTIANKTPLDSNISELIKELEDSRKKLREEQSSLPKEIRAFEGAKDKYIFTGLCS